MDENFAYLPVGNNGKEGMDDNQHEVVTLYTEEEESSKQLNIYPSSPAVLEISSDTLEQQKIVEASNCSIELNAPYFEDISSSRDGEVSSLIENEVGENEPIVGKGRKRLLDEILDDSSSITCRTIDPNSESISNIIKTTPFRDVSTKRNNVESTPKGLPPILPIIPTRMHKTGISNSICPDTVANQLSPTSIVTKRKHLPLCTTIDSPADYNSEVLDSDELKSNTASKSNRSQYLGLYNNQNRMETHEKASESEITALNMGNESSCSEEDLPSLLSTDMAPAKDPPDILEDDGYGNGIFTSYRHIEQENKSRLDQYIVQGDYFSKERSESLIRKWLQKNKTLFKQVNQIPRDNVKARQAIVVEIAEQLSKNFETSVPDLKEILLPASLKNIQSSRLPLIKFSRKCDSTYDYINDVYYPCASSLIEENVVMLYYSAKEFFERYKEEKQKLLEDIRMLSRDRKYLIVVLSELGKFKRSLQAIENQRYKDKVQEGLHGMERNKTQGRTQSSKNLHDLGMNYFDVLQRIQHVDRMWGVKIHTVSSDSDFIRTLPNLLSIIGKQRMDPNIRFMRYSHISVKSCKDQTEVFKKTLHEINKMPDLKACSVVAAYPTFQSLLKDFERGELKSGLDGKHIMTEAMEGRLFKLLTCRDPDQTIQ